MQPETDTSLDAAHLVGSPTLLEPLEALSKGESVDYFDRPAWRAKLSDPTELKGNLPLGPTRETREGTIYAFAESLE